MAISRRTCLLALTLMVGVLLALTGGIGLLTENDRANAQVAERPNIVFVMTDDLDEQSMKELPGIQQVMQAQGTTFKNAYVSYALCCPSRATFLRGQYPHNHGVLGLDTGGVPGGEQTFRQLGRDQSTVATWLNDAGYQTKHIGKYINGYGDLYKPPGWDEWFTLQGPPPTTQYTVASSAEKTGRTVTMEGHSTDLYRDQAIDFIRRSSANPEPFFVVVDTLAPHGPPEVADRYQNHFTDTLLPRPANFNEEVVSDKPAWVQSYPRFSQDEINRIQDRYRWRLRSMLSVEDLLEQTIATLQETQELDNTYIFFTSDNGMHLGNHRFAQGKKTPYEEAIGVPLMVRGPGVPPGEVREQLVINNDFAPTIADLAEVTTPQFVDGSSFAPLLTGSPPPSWRTAFLEEGWLDSGLPNIRTPDHKSVHTRTHMFTEYRTGEYELYDLVRDSAQLESKPRAGNEQLYSELQSRLDALRACSGTGCRDAEWAPDTTTTPPTEPPPPSTACTITGTTNAETISGSSGNDVICAGGGNDTLKALEGNDTLRGEGGNDTLLGGVGDDALDGGLGTDTASYSASLTAVTASLATNPATGEGSDTFLGVENLLGSSKADTLTGSATNNKLTGGGGADTERGGLGDDQVIGSGGADSLYGEDGNDTVNSKDGVNGNDSLDGGAGTDTRVSDTTEKSIVGFP